MTAFETWYAELARTSNVPLSPLVKTLCAAAWEASQDHTVLALWVAKADPALLRLVLHNEKETTHA